MIVYVNDRYEIKDVNTTTDTTLIPIEIPEGHPFANWSVAKICCFKLSLEDGQYRGFAPYVDTKIIEHIERLGSGNESNSNNIGDLSSAILKLCEMYVK